MLLYAAFTAQTTWDGEPGRTPTSSFTQLHSEQALIIERTVNPLCSDDQSSSFVSLYNCIVSSALQCNSGAATPRMWTRPFSHGIGPLHREAAAGEAMEVT